MDRRPLTICAIGASTSTHVASRVKCFAERGHRVFLICDSRTGIEGVTELVAPEALSDHVWLLRALDAASLRLRGRPIWRLRLLSVVLNVARLIRRCRPDIVHVHYAYNLSAWLAMLAERHPLVVSVMGGDILFDEQGSPTPSGRRLTLRLLESADLITSKSDFLVGVLDRLGGFGAKTIKVMWGVDLKHFRRTDAGGLRASLGLGREERVILSPRILQRFYNVHVIVEAMPQIVAAVPEARLLITEYQADPAYRSEISQRVEALGLQEHVRFVGAVPHLDMPQHYSLAEVTVGVPPSDGMPQTVLEGMACGAPSIVSRLPRYEELVTHGESAFFVDITPQSVADGVIRLLKDAALRERIASTGRQIVATDGDFDREVDRVEGKYYELLSTSRRRGLGFIKRARIIGQMMRHLMGRDTSPLGSAGSRGDI
jgi:glycosyltransferase involved in cell wall biosynthesis